jgi:UDP-N-acetylmuramoyl-tripeptide--D-alanyl-D-alanine ligase
MSTPIPRPAVTGFWTLDRISDTLGSGLRGAQPLGAIVTDSRHVERGDIFVALKGERFDGHDYLEDVVGRGAAAVIVSHMPRVASLGVPVFDVEDTLVALGALAACWRRAWGKPIVAIAGSNGKTSTKELLVGVLSSRLSVASTSGNLNNRIGVPLTLLAIHPGADIAVIEIGTSLPGEVAILREMVRPDVALVTSIAEEHLEGLGDLEGVLREETSIFAGVKTAVVPADAEAIVAEAERMARRVLRAGLDSGDIRATRWSVDDEGRGMLQLDELDIQVPLRGAHNLRNAMLAIAAGRVCGIATEDAAVGIQGARGAEMRMSREGLGHATIINDAYNSNPGSVRAALDELSRASGRQRVAVLGTMRELGAASMRCHDEAARQALASGVEIVAGLGDFADALARIAPNDRRVVTGTDIDALWAGLAPRLEPDAVILLKASRGVRLERLVPLLTQWAQSI